MPLTKTPSHAPRISTLLSQDKEFAPCRVSRRAIRCRAVRGPEGGGGYEAISLQGRVRLEVQGRAGASAPEGEGMYRNRGEVQAGRNTGEVRAGR